MARRSLSLSVAAMFVSFEVVLLLGLGGGAHARRLLHASPERGTVGRLLARLVPKENPWAGCPAVYDPEAFTPVRVLCRGAGAETSSCCEAVRMTTMEALDASNGDRDCIMNFFNALIDIGGVSEEVLSVCADSSEPILPGQNRLEMNPIARFLNVIQDGEGDSAPVSVMAPVFG